jgi:two-component system, cell cycle sensor histidine kinase and response regulator CckA
MNQPADSPQRRVLVLDDEGTIRRMLDDLLTAEGYTVVCASDAAEALAVIDSEVELGVAILDKNLPDGVSGLEVLARIRQSSPLTRCMIFTGYASTESAIAALQTGAFDYIEKPIDIQLMREKVKRAWQSYQLAASHDDLFKKYETLFEIVPGIVWFMTQNGVLTRINQEGAAMLGYAPADLLGHPYEMLLPANEVGPASHWTFKERRTGQRGTRRQVVELKARSGATRLFEISATGAYDRPPQDPTRRFWGTLGVGWDITEHALLQEQLQQACKMEAIGRLAGGVAHDFNNLLSVIINNAEIIRSDLAAGDPHLEDLQEIQLAAATAADLTRQLLAFSRKHLAEQQVVDVGDVAHGIEGLLRRLVPENIEFSIHRDREPCRCRADSSQLEQVLINLVANARDSMPNGGRLRVQVSHAVLDAEFAASHINVVPGPYIMLAISDTGHGMSPEVREHLFEPFFTTKAPGRGTGLGLATVYGIVRQCGGHISVYSELNTGTSVKIYVPAVLDPAELETRASPVELAPGRETVLVVEDDAMVRRLVRRILERNGYKVVDAEDGAKALELFDRTAFDVLVTDMVMPKISGTALAQQLRARSPMLRVIYMSGYVGTVATDHPMLDEQATFVQKPFTAQALLSALRQLLDGPPETGSASSGRSS